MPEASLNAHGAARLEVQRAVFVDVPLVTVFLVVLSAVAGIASAAASRLELARRRRLVVSDQQLKWRSWMPAPLGRSPWSSPGVIACANGDVRDLPNLLG